MKATAKLRGAALAVAAIGMTTGALAADHGGHSGARAAHGSWSGNHGTWAGHRGVHAGRGYYGGGHRYWGGPRYGFYFGVPVFWGAAWGYPYYYGYPYYDYPRETVVYREVERMPEGEMLPSTEVPRTEGAPSQGPLYMNYCESARAYFPKVTACPEGWKFIAPNR